MNNGNHNNFMVLHGFSLGVLYTLVVADRIEKITSEKS